MRQRLPSRSPVDYQVRRDNFVWADHVLRVQLTGALISWFAPDTVLDPACGDGTIVAAAHKARPIAGAHLADISRPNFYATGTEMRPYLPEISTFACAPAEETLAEDRFFDLVVLTEFLEHVEDPVSILRMARKRARMLVASSPLIADDGQVDDNPEHIWQFDAPGYQELLEEGGWQPLVFIPVRLIPVEFDYDFQIWGAS